MSGIVHFRHEDAFRRACGLQQGLFREGPDRLKLEHAHASPLGALGRRPRRPCDRAAGHDESVAALRIESLRFDDVVEVFLDLGMELGHACRCVVRRAACIAVAVMHGTGDMEPVTVTIGGQRSDLAPVETEWFVLFRRD